MSNKITVPDIGDFESVEIIEILVKKGDQIKKMRQSWLISELSVLTVGAAAKRDRTSARLKIPKLANSVSFFNVIPVRLQKVMPDSKRSHRELFQTYPGI